MTDEIRTCAGSLLHPGVCCFSICGERATEAVLTAHHDHLIEHTRCAAHTGGSEVVSSKPLVWDPEWGPLGHQPAEPAAPPRLCEPLPEVEDLQWWERCVPGSDVAIERLVVAVGDGDGTARIQQSVLAQLLVDAGWERAS